MATRIRVVVASAATSAAALIALHVFSASAWQVAPSSGAVTALYIGPCLVAGHETPAGPARAGAATWFVLFLVELGARSFLVPPLGGPSPRATSPVSWLLGLMLLTVLGGFVGSIGGMMARSRRVSPPSAP